MNYKLKTGDSEQKSNLSSALKRLVPLLVTEKKYIIIATIAVLISAAINLYSPILIGNIIDKYIQNKDLTGVLLFSSLLFLLYLTNLFTHYTQMKTMGGVGRRILFNLRNLLFKKLQELPISFFDQNKAGDLISRINNDTDKLNQFFSQALMQFVNNIVIIIGSGVFLLILNIELGINTLLPALGILITTKLLSSWVRKTNFKSLQTLGAMSGEIQESFNNFKVIIAFNRIDYFREKFKEVNQKNYKASIISGIANNIFLPIYTLAGNIAQLIVLALGIYLISQGSLTIGLLVTYLIFVDYFYSPLKQMASVWSSLQLALAAVDRISEILELESDMPTKKSIKKETGFILEFQDVSFGYPEQKEVLHNINFKLEKGKTYAMVGPTGGGKTTTASLAARLYDPTKGIILLDGQDIRTYNTEERTHKIGFILQEPFLFSGTLLDNIICGNREYQETSKKDLIKELEKLDLIGLLNKFENGIDTKIENSDIMSLGQKQLIAFIRAILRKPELLILDEATANIDTVTEQSLEKIIEKLPKTTTKIIIAHRLNTIENADQIFFINNGSVTAAGSIDQAINMLMNEKRKS